MTQLNKSAERAQAVLEKAKSVRNSLPQISVRQFVSTASKRNNPAAWLTEVEKQVKRMRSVLRIPVDQTADKPVHAPPSLIASLPLPSWLQTMHKSKRIRGVSRSGKEYLRIRRAPNELFHMSVDLMVDHHTPSSQVPGIINTCWSPLGISIDDYDICQRRTHNNYRQMIPWISRVQVSPPIAL